MIAQLRGILLEKHPQQAIVECGGVGYDVAIPVSTYTALPDLGHEVKLRIHTHVREDAIQLFGFASASELDLFGRLISVSGIGPKLANTVLSGVQAEDLKAAIRSGDVQRLTRVPGIGKKTAERIVLELRDKIDLSAASVLPKGAPVPLAGSDAERDAVSALINLGSQPAAAETAVRKAVDAGIAKEFEPLFRKALELLR
jgi:Holliday junction DNA helicase RuvA